MSPLSVACCVVSWQHDRMAEIVNLRRVKKARAREAAAREAALNRARHGRPASERLAEAQRAALRERTLDGAALSAGDGETGE